MSPRNGKAGALCQEERAAPYELITVDGHTAAVVDAVLSSATGELRFATECRACGRFHHHGARGAGLGSLQHRISHCALDDTPVGRAVFSKKCDYFLKVVAIVSEFPKRPSRRGARGSR